MPKSVSKGVETFVSFFRKQLQAIESLKVEQHHEGKNLFQRILYVGVIDTLSKTAYPKKLNRDRMVSFLRRFVTWEYSERVSLPHLVSLLERSPEPEFSDLRHLAYSELSKWQQGSVIGLEKDLEATRVKALWPKEKGFDEPIEGVTLELLQHIRLFYVHRNHLVHEMRHPGHGMDFDPDDTNPYYHSMTHIEGETKTATWELVYPLGFLKRICAEALEKLERYYIDEQVNPYHAFAFGTYWIDELNRPGG